MPSISDDPRKEAYIAQRKCHLNGVELQAGQLVLLPKAIDPRAVPDGLVCYDEQIHGRRCRTVEQDGFPVGYIQPAKWDPWKILER